LSSQGTKNGATPWVVSIFVTKDRRKIDRHKCMINCVQALTTNY